MGYPMVLVQKWPFFQLFFLGSLGQENVFYNVLEQKNAVLGYKNKKFKKSKNYHFSKKVNPWFWLKNGHFSNFFFLAVQARKVSFKIFQNKKNFFLAYKNKKFKKSKNYHFFKGVNPWFWSKNGHFSNFFFFGNRGQKNVFYNIVEQNNAFLGYKNKKFKKSKN